ncbi:transposase [Tetragenococcus koreensis]|uniref:Transposase n=1 Tax=Tetragenococcus koreensis TaxID=290335 RepID=A0AAN4ZNU0_9ENTE|nr:transposase [Tetragenococcus koreensis]GEQ49691.1 transposase [Tetragenococcus koreensis]GEQ52137.1 transposase [Tetragenococcus koreensis]GEQ54665.1 transposase [Tetragenococcus koreensis]GEQ57139.1 transposase [Tetragenococcus koreensis]
MKVLKGYKFRIYPNEKQIQYFIQTFGCVRFTYNHLLHARQKALQAGDYQTQVSPASLKRDYPFLKKTDSLALANAQRNLDRAFKNYFSKRAGYPKLKTKKNNWQSYTTNNQKHTIYFVGNQLKLPKLKSLVTVNLHRKVAGEIKSATVSAQNNQMFFVSLLCLEEINPLPKTGTTIGVAYCPENLVQMSAVNRLPVYKQETLQYQLDKAIKRLEVRAKAAKRRKVLLEQAKNYQKQKSKVQKLYMAKNDQKKNYIDQLTYRLVHDYDCICLEKQPEFTENTKFSETDWQHFLRKIQYKARWYDKQLVFVDSIEKENETKCFTIEQVGKKLINQ